MSKSIGKYVYDEKQLLGSGSFGRVYKGTDTTTNMPVAVKVSSKKNVRKEVLDILHNEINVVKHLNHPHLVRTYDVYDTSDCLIVVMEICQNDLKHTISTKHLSEQEVQQIIRQLILGLKELVRLGLLHRDIKPANCFDFDGVYKLGDFGSMIEADYSGKKQMKQEFGTLAYECPQMLTREKYTTKCDIWSFGILIYELLFNQTPWITQNPSQQIRTIKMCPLRFPLNQSISKGCKDLISRCLIISEKDRIGWEELFEHPWLHQDVQFIEQINDDEKQEKLINHINIIARDQGINPKQTFNNYDVDDQGYLDYEKFERFFMQFDPRLTSSEIILLFKLSNTNGQYKISEQQFSQLFTE